MSGDGVFPWLRRPSAVVPLLLSAAAFALIGFVLATVGVTRPADEGAPARLFQLLLALEVPFVVFFAAKWLPRDPGPASRILLLQVVLALAAVATVEWLERAAG